MNNSEDIVITSDYGKYNINNYDTIFSKNLKIYYLDNKITAEYGDFSIGRNSMIISKEVIYTNPENILKADVVKVNIETKDSVIYMHEENKKVNIKSIIKKNTIQNILSISNIDNNILILLNNEKIINLNVEKWSCTLEDIGKPIFPAITPAHLKNE